MPRVRTTSRVRGTSAHLRVQWGYLERPSQCHPQCSNDIHTECTGRASLSLWLQISHLWMDTTLKPRKTNLLQLKDILALLHFIFFKLRSLDDFKKLKKKYFFQSSSESCQSFVKVSLPPLKIFISFIVTPA